MLRISTQDFMANTFKVFLKSLELFYALVKQFLKKIQTASSGHMNNYHDLMISITIWLLICIFHHTCI